MKPYYSDDHVTIYHGDCREILPVLNDRFDLKCFRCGASASLPLGMTCSDHDPQIVRQYDVVVTDPPYGMALSSGRPRAAANAEMGDLSVANDHDHTVRDEVLAMCSTTPALVFGRWSVPRPVGTRMVLTWEKGEHVGMGDLSLPWKPNTEEVYVLGRGFVGARTGSVLRHLAVAGCIGTANTGRRHHPTEKPVKLMRELITKCPPGVILDPFMGSGTTLRAAKDLGRKAIGIELEERYCEVAAKRMAQEVLDLGGVS